MFIKCELVKAKTIVDWQIKEHMHDSFVHTIKELQVNDSTSQAPINPNKPFHLNWVTLPY